MTEKKTSFHTTRWVQGSHTSPTRVSERTSLYNTRANEFANSWLLHKSLWFGKPRGINIQCVGQAIQHIFYCLILKFFHKFFRHWWVALK